MVDMDRLALEESGSRFAAFVGSLNEVIGHRDRIGPFRSYCAGLLAGCERKSVEPLAAITAPERVSAQHQSLLHFVGKACWSDAAVLSKVREWTMPILEKHGPVEAFIIDDTGFPKKGKHSVGVARQYCGQLGKQDNCQIAVSLSVANRHASLPIAYRLYLPQEWANDRTRRAKAGVPEDVTFQTKPEIALAQIAQAKRTCRSGRRGIYQTPSQRSNAGSPPPGTKPAAMSMLRQRETNSKLSIKLVTQ